MDLEFFVHGVPNGQKVWGKKDDPSYFQSLYNNFDSVDKFLIELRTVNDKNYCYYSYLRYGNIVDYDNRPGAYFGLTIRLDVYSLDVIRLYQILDLLYKNDILGHILSIDGRRYIVQSFDDSVIDEIYDKFKRLLSCTFQNRDFISVPQQSTIEYQGSIKLNLYDCQNEDMVSKIQDLVFKSTRIIISPEYLTFKEAEIQKNCDRDKAAIEKAKAMEIARLNASLSKEKSDVASLSEEIKTLNNEKKVLQSENKKLQLEAHNCKESIKTEILTVWKLVISDVFRRQRTNFTGERMEDIPDADRPKKSIGHILAVVFHFLLLLIIAGACTFLVCNSLGFGKDSSETEEYLSKIESLQTENKRLLEDLSYANVKIEKLGAENEKLSDTLNKQKKEKQVVKEQPKEPRIDVDVIKGKKKTLSVGEECVIRIMNLDDTKGGKWDVSNAEMKEQNERKCKIRVKEGGPVVIKYLKDGKEVDARTLQVETKAVEKEQVEGKKSEEK